jgi:proline iminopeptidase
MKSVILAFCLMVTTMLNGEEKRTLYPPIEPYQSGYLTVDGGHQIYWEESGNPKGKPILFLHGGPGVGTRPYHRCFFNPELYRIILFDQRGCGKSVPFSQLDHNTTWDLISDTEQLRKHLKVDRWVVFGGSWGSTLALAYAIQHPQSVKGLILRGIFLCRPEEIQWYYQSGADNIYPDEWEKYMAPIPPAERNDFVKAYYKRLTSTNEQERKVAAQSWSGWEGSTSKLHFDPALFADFTAEQSADAIARIECHYFVHNAFFKTDNWILDNIQTIQNIPCVIVQGRYDIPCPIKSAWDLHRAWPEAELFVIPDAGHAATEPGTLDALIRATDRFSDL